jgi:hypothetical protein
MTRRIATRLAAAYGLQVTRSQIGSDVWGVIVDGSPVWAPVMLAVRLAQLQEFGDVEEAMSDVMSYLPGEQ